MIASNPEAVRAMLTDGAAWLPWDSDVGGADGQMPLGPFRALRAFEVSPDGNGERRSMSVRSTPGRCWG